MLPSIALLGQAGQAPDNYSSCILLHARMQAGRQADTCVGNVRMYVYIYIYPHIYISIYIIFHTYIQASMHVQIYVHIQVCMHVCVHTCTVHTNKYVCMHVCLHACMSICPSVRLFLSFCLCLIEVCMHVPGLGGPWDAGPPQKRAGGSDVMGARKKQYPPTRGVTEEPLDCQRNECRAQRTWELRSLHTACTKR